MKTVLISAIYGGHDSVKPLPANHGFDDAVMITDDPDLEAPGWRVMVEPAGSMRPRMAAKLPKFQPFNFVDADVAVWLDGSFLIRSDNFRIFCEESLGDHDFTVWSHPDLATRDCLYLEALECQNWPKYREDPIPDQTAFYRSQGMPEHFGLWACGTIVWRNSDQAKQFGSRWLMENIRWSIQDQISFPFLIWKHEPNFGVFPAHEYDNPHLIWNRHNTEL
jgi:hypothetical protein